MSLRSSCRSLLLFVLVTAAVLPGGAQRASRLQPDVAEQGWHSLNSKGTDYGQVLDQKRANVVRGLGNRLVWSNCIFLMAALGGMLFWWLELRHNCRFQVDVATALEDALNAYNVAHEHATEASRENERLVEELSRQSMVKSVTSTPTDDSTSAARKPGNAQPEANVAKQLEASLERERNGKNQNATLRQEKADLSKTVTEQKQRMDELEKENEALRKQWNSRPKPPQSQNGETPKA